MLRGKERLVVAGVSYRKTALEVRNKFAFTTDAIKRIYQAQPNGNPARFFILSTCNRTEIYGITDEPETFAELLIQQSGMAATEAQDYIFEKQGEEAVQHLFRVASGLDSQIIGDYEIVGQLKNAFQLSKDNGCASGYLEKLVNAAIQTSRQVRNNTSISDGTTSVAYAVIQHIKQYTTDNVSLNISLLGLGKIGLLTLKNLKTYLPQHRITLINRNEEKAENAAQEFGVNYFPFSSQSDAIRQSDVLIVATGAAHTIIERNDIENSNVKLLFDLSVPSNVNREVKHISGLNFYDIDQLSHTVNQNISQREKQIPLAEKIVQKHTEDFFEWETRRAQYIGNKQSVAV